jgi:hypothetical protein
MTPAKAASIARDLSSVARKVLEAVPIEESWPDTAIYAQLRRCGSSVSMDIVRGCIETLRKAGLVREPQPRHFQRVPVREREPIPSFSESNIRIPTMPTLPLNSPSIVAAICAPASTINEVEKVAAKLRGLADDLEEIAIRLDDERKALANDSEQLGKFRALMKSMAI